MIKAYCFCLSILTSISFLQASSWQEWRKESFNIDFKRPSFVALNLGGESTVDIYEEKESDGSAPSNHIQILIKDLDHETWFDTQTNALFIKGIPFDRYFKNHYKVVLPFDSKTKIFLKANHANAYTENTSDIWAYIEKGKFTAKNTRGEIDVTVVEPGKDRTSFELYNPKKNVFLNAPHARGLIFSPEKFQELYRFEFEGEHSEFHWYAPFEVVQHLPKTFELNTRDDQPYRSTSLEGFLTRVKGPQTKMVIHGHSEIFSQKSTKYLMTALKVAQKSPK